MVIAQNKPGEKDWCSERRGEEFYPFPLAHNLNEQRSNFSCVKRGIIQDNANIFAL